MEKNIIPQVPLFDLLKKFDGLAEKVSIYNYIHSISCVTWLVGTLGLIHVLQHTYTTVYTCTCTFVVRRKSMDNQTLACI